MATLTITLNIPDAQQARVMAMLRAEAANAQNPTPTNPQALAAFTQWVGQQLKRKVLAHEQDALAAGADPVDVT